MHVNRIRKKEKKLRESPRGVVANVLDCGIRISELESYVNFQNNTHEKNMKPFTQPQLWVKQFFFKVSFGIKTNHKDPPPKKMTQIN